MSLCTRTLYASLCAVGVLGAAKRAHADPLPSCDQASGVVALDAVIEQVPDDGVLVMEVVRGAQPSVPLENVLGFFGIEVVDGGGASLPGVLESAFERVVWRPLVPLIVDDTLTATVTVDNAGIATVDGQPECVLADLEVPLSLGVAPDSLGSIPLHGAIIDIEPFEEPSAGAGLDQLVCCDGALPVAQIDECTREVVTQWDVGHCEPQLGQRRVAVTGELTWAITVDPIATANFLPVLTYADQTMDFASPSGEALSGPADVEGCGSVLLWDFAGLQFHEVVSACSDPVEGGMLGPFDRDPAPGLAENCVNPPYTCAVVDDAWDELDCSPWPASEPPDSDSGSESGSGDPGDGSDGDDSGDAVADDDFGDDYDDQYDDDDYGGGGGSGCQSVDEHDHSDDSASGCAYCGQGSGRPPWLLFFLLLGVRRRPRGWVKRR